MSDGHHHSAEMTIQVDALEEALRDRGFLEGLDLEAMVERFLSSAQPANGAQLVARAWVDDEFRQRLLDDATTAIEELGYSMRRGMQPDLRFRVVANDDAVHNLLVCTLCSCYPIALLGPPPRWYRSLGYRSRAVSEPRTVLRESGLELDPQVRIDVWDSTSDLRYIEGDEPGQLRRVVDTSILPIINTGIAHKEAGIGQIGAGITSAPKAVFDDAIVALAAARGGQR